MATETLIFEDEFKNFDLNTWKHEITMGGGGNWEFEMYVNDRRNSYVDDGILYLKPSLTSDIIGEDSVRGTNSIPDANRFSLWGGAPADMCTSNMWWGCERTATPTNILNPIRSARLRTAESFSFKYGRVEVKAKLPKGDWLWPAIWMQPESQAFGLWPASGEIDIMESRGNGLSYKNSKGDSLGYNSFGSTLHWGPSYEKDLFDLTHGEYVSEPNDLVNNFHVYGLYWDDEEIYTYIDDPSNVVMRVEGYGKDFEGWFEKGLKSGKLNKDDYNPWSHGSNLSPFDEEMFLILNLAVGGTSDYFPDDIGNKPWNNKGGAASQSFYDAKDEWLPSWTDNQSNTISDNAALQIESVKIYSIPGKTTYTYHKNAPSFTDSMVKSSQANGLSENRNTWVEKHIAVPIIMLILFVAAITVVRMKLKSVENYGRLIDPPIVVDCKI